tara:strand:- start:1072 stop:2142 length:1071 start_codon:yes stop_codon:yes gene_type:complete
MSKIKIHDPFFGKEEKLAINAVLESHQWASSKGNNKVSEFEKKFKSFVNSDECIAVDSGSSALLLSMSLMDVKNKEVILPSLCHVSAAHAVTLNGGKPIFVDVDPKNLCLDLDLVKKAITKKTKVIVPVHFGGMSCDLKKIQELCKNFKINLIEDAALATGSKYKNKKIGSHGDAVCFSFHPVKIMSAPKGGAITLNGKNSKKFKKILLASRNSGILNDNSVNHVGWNSYMNEFSAAICLEQLKKLNKMISIRYNTAKKYYKKINVEQKMPLDTECSYNFYWIFVKNPTTFIEKMRQNNIEIGRYHPPIHLLKYYKTNKKLKNTEIFAKSHILLPTHPNLSSENIEKIIRLTNKFS